MTEQQRDILEAGFRKWERRSTILVLILFGVIMAIHTIDPYGDAQIWIVKWLFRICLGLVLGFILAEFLRDLFFPIMAKFIFRDDVKKPTSSDSTGQ